MKYHVRHVTELSYAAPVALAQFNLRLVPAPWRGQRMGRHDLRLDPQPEWQDEFAGPWCVNTTHIAYSAPIENIELESEFDVEVTANAVSGHGPAISQVRAEALSERNLSAVSPASYVYASRIAGTDIEIGTWAAGHLAEERGIIDAARSLTAAIHREFAYEPGVTDSATLPKEAFVARRGVCQDFAHVMITALRANGLPAAYASGYLRTEPPPGKPRLIGADAMHAWVNVWCGTELRWVGFDPTNDCLVREDHIQIAMGRDYADVAPIDGTFLGSSPQSMNTYVDVMPLVENA